MLLVLSKITLTFAVDAVGHLPELVSSIFGSFSSLRFVDRVSLWYWQDGITFITVSRYYSCQRNEDAIFLPEIFCCVESNLVRNSPNEPLCSLVQNNFHSQSNLKNIILELYNK